MSSANNRVAAGVDLGGTKIQTVGLRDREVAGGSREPTPHSTRHCTCGHRGRDHLSSGVGAAVLAGG